METSSDIAVSPFVNKVFELELLREMILEYTIVDYNGNKPVRRRRMNACTCRLVSKAWLQSTSRVLFKLNEPLFLFRIEDYWCDAPKFVARVVRNKLIDQRVPPFTLSAQYFHTVNANNIRLRHCFTHCGIGLVRLSLLLSDEHASMTLGRDLNLPKLQSLTIHSYSFTHFNGVTHQQINVIQSIFNACQQLKSFQFLCMHHNKLGPNNELSNLVLPSTLTHLHLDCMQANCKVDVLLKNPPPKLKNLYLGVNSASFENGALTSILEKVRKTLTALGVGKEYLADRYKGPTTFRLPLMEKLKHLHIDITYLELEGPLSCWELERLIPILSEMQLNRQTAAMFRKWTEGSCFESVNSLAVSLVNDNLFQNFDESYYYRRVNFDVGTMNTLRAAFPTVVELEITFYDGPARTVFGIILQMTQLKSLTIFVEQTRYERKNSNVFDALFLGIPEKSVKALRNAPDSSKALSAHKKTTSIRNLTNLETLHLGPSNMFLCVSINISNLSFELAFLKMPRLTNIILDQPFRTTSLMTEKWIKERRTITFRSRDCFGRFT